MEIPDGSFYMTDMIGDPPPAYLELFSAAEPQDRAQTLQLLRQTIARLTYLEFVKGTCEGGESQMVWIHVRGRRAPAPVEMIKSDLRMLWQLQVARSSDAIFQIVDTTIGFDFRFALLHENGDFISGNVIVDLFEPHIELAA
jgi:hypothetical protein